MTCDFDSVEILEKALADAVPGKIGKIVINTGWDYEIGEEPSARYESPIELLLACALAVTSRVDNIGWHNSTEFGMTYDECVEILNASTALVGIFSQVKIEPYTVDFMFLYRHMSTKEVTGIVVECDGHAFHERTKEQAAHDKSRDRFIQSEGFKVLRFTGSEIWNNTYGCVNEIVAAAWRSGAPRPSWYKEQPNPEISEPEEVHA